MRSVRKAVLRLLFLALLGLGAVLLYGYARSHPEDLPWTPLDLSRPVGAATAGKLAGLADQGGRCKALLDRAGVDYRTLPPVRDGRCGYEHGVRPAGGSLAVDYRPAGLGTNCAVAAGLALWEWHVLQPAALEHLGAAVETVEHLGSYSCRRLYGRDEGRWSEHASANAVDIAGFRLEDGTRVSVREDWGGDGPRAAFLRDVRDGACEIFATTLSPDYNEAHRDHFHFDLAQRPLGWSVCR